MAVFLWLTSAVSISIAVLQLTSASLFGLAKVALFGIFAECLYTCSPTGRSMVGLPRNKWPLPSLPGRRTECALMRLLPDTQSEMPDGRNVSEIPHTPVPTRAVSLDSLSASNMFRESVNSDAQFPLHFRGFAL